MESSPYVEHEDSLSDWKGSPSNFILSKLNTLHVLASSCFKVHFMYVYSSIYACVFRFVCSVIFFTKMSPALAICPTHHPSSFDHFHNIWCITYCEAVRYVLYLHYCSRCVPSTSVMLSPIALCLTVDYICYSFNRQRISLICDKCHNTKSIIFSREAFKGFEVL